jgi:L-asparaginase II
MNPILTEIFRGPQRESFHRGAIAVLQKDQLHLQMGDIDEPAYPRSALKPFQILPLLEAGLHRKLQLSSREIAVITASHGGDERHVETVREILRRGEIHPDLLGCGLHAPLDRRAAERLNRSNQEPTVLHHNCSGKHSGMLLLAKHLQADLSRYLEQDHPVQLRIRQRIADCTGLKPDQLVADTDGCSAPAFVLSLRQLATALASLADPRELAPATAAAVEELFTAVTAEPHFIGGEGVFDSALITAGKGQLLCKRGAEGVLGLVVRRPGQPGVGIALKIDDGAERGYFQPTIQILRWLGLRLSGLEELLTRSQRGQVRSHQGRVVGEIRTSVELKQALEP